MEVMAMGQILSSCFAALTVRCRAISMIISTGSFWPQSSRSRSQIPTERPVSHFTTGAGVLWLTTLPYHLPGFHVSCSISALSLTGLFACRENPRTGRALLVEHS